MAKMFTGAHSGIKATNSIGVEIDFNSGSFNAAFNTPSPAVV
jgi:hypothetical protein